MLSLHDSNTAAVHDLQLKLLRLGQVLPKWGPDGDLGGETMAAIAGLLRQHGRTFDVRSTSVDDSILALINQLAHDAEKPPTEMPPTKLIDRRKFASRVHDYGQRAVVDIKGVTLHQTACVLSSSKDPARCDAVGAHYVIMRGANGYYSDGDVIWLHDETRLIVHGNEWNTQCWGIEIDGLFAGLKGDPRTVWDNPKTGIKEKEDQLTDAQVESTLQLIRWRRAELQRMGGHMKVMSAHRQSSADRRDDPGQDSWQRVALPLIKELGLSDGGPGFVLGGSNGGYPIPHEWDPEDPAKAKYSYFDPPSYKPVR